jgi:hypothetical protein
VFAKSNGRCAIRDPGESQVGTGVPADAPLRAGTEAGPYRSGCRRNDRIGTCASDKAFGSTYWYLVTRPY